jgi:hypothetical protein
LYLLTSEALPSRSDSHRCHYHYNYYRTLSQIGHFPLNCLENPKMSSLFFDAARRLLSFPKQSPANEVYMRIYNELPIQIALTHSINLAG